MKQTIRHYLAIGTVMACGHLSASAVDDTADKTAIEQSVASYVAAFNAHDSAALAAHWSPEAVYTNPSTGNQVVGLEAIKQEFNAILSKRKDDKLAVDIVSIEFVSPNVAVENGLATVVGLEGEPETSNYTAIHVKRDGKWLLDRVSEAEKTSLPSHYEQLQDLEWMIGTWLDASENELIETTCKWARNNNFIVRSFKVIVEDRISTSGMQIIGWDSAKGKIRSWAFDSDGGFAEGTWRKNENRWIVESNATLPGGEKSSSINIMTVIDKDTFGWQSTGREVDGKLLPNIDEVKVTRVTTPE